MFGVAFDLVKHEGADEDLSPRVPCAFLLCDACPDGFLPRLDGGLLPVQFLEAFLERFRSCPSVSSTRPADFLRCQVPMDLFRRVAGWPAGFPVHMRFSLSVSCPF